MWRSRCDVNNYYVRQQPSLQFGNMAACCSRGVDYSVPLHVDCSVEYELPAHAKPPQGVKVEPLLMIHPCHFRRLESQRRRPFVNNMPRRRPRPYDQPWQYAAAYQPYYDAPGYYCARQRPQLYQPVGVACYDFV